MIEQQDRTFERSVSVSKTEMKLVRVTYPMWVYICEDCDHTTAWMTDRWARWAADHHSDRCKGVVFDEAVSSHRKGRGNRKR